MSNNRPVEYLQTDSKWSSISYATAYETATIGGSGCGPTAMAMAIATWVDSSVTPVETCAWSVANGYKATGNGTYHSYFVPQAAAYGLECEKVNTDSLLYYDRTTSQPYHDIAKEAVEEGHLVVCLMGPGNWTNGGHYILWYDVDGDDVLINDPASTSSTRERNTHELLMQEVRYYWIIKVPEEVISMTNTEVLALIEEKAKTIADARIANYFSELSGTVPSSWADQVWYSACKAGILDGSSPRGYFTREMYAAVATRLGDVELLEVPEDFDFENPDFS